MGVKQSSVIKRFHDKMCPGEDIASDCWKWTGARGSRGYGRFYFDGASRDAHRAAYLLFVGDIPQGWTVDHLCRNRSCVNPAHLEAVTFRENCRRGNTPVGDNARKTHCKYGHEFTPENTYWHSRRGHPCRMCRECMRRRDGERAKTPERRAQQRAYRRLQRMATP